VSDDPQDVAEALDEDKADEVDDFAGDVFGDDLPDYPPERPLGVNTVGVTAVEEDAGDSFAERTRRQVPDVDDDAVLDTSPDVGQLVEPDASTVDAEAQLVADAERGEPLTAEEAAMHIEEL
jgi:hypothetical protein